MFCNHCGNELNGTEAYCATCGKPVQETGAQTQVGAPHGAPHHRTTMNAYTNTSTPEDTSAYRSFEYARTTIKSELAQVAIDCYESLGYELTGQRVSAPGGQVTLSFRRSRKVRGKAQLSKIQRTMDDTLASITSMETEKTKKAIIQAMTIGIISALVLGLGMSCTMVWTHLMVLGIVVGLIGIAGCIFAWMHYRKVCSIETARLNPAIEEAYDRLATQCEEAQAILRNSGDE